jgi:monovalent cation/proton antiporter MnhG/PhaG subunit
MGMTGPQIAELVLVAIGVLTGLLCCVGLVVMRDVFDRLHFLSAASTVAPIPIVVAVLINQRLNAVGIKSLLILLISVVTGPVLTHAIGRAARIRERGDARPRPEERVER